METVNEENKVVEYEIITTKKYRQVVKVQFDERHSDELDETKITPGDIVFGLGEEIKGEVSFSTKMVNEPPERFITFNGNTKRSLCWGRIVPNETKSVLYHTRTLVSGKELTSIIIYLNCPLDLVEQLWNGYKIKELSS